MKIEEKRKLYIELTPEEWKKLNEAEKIINNIANNLDGYGFYDKETEEFFESLLSKIVKLDDLLDGGFESNIVEER